MRKSSPVDTMPQFEPLAVRASNLMLAAKSHRSKNDVFEAAVSWMEAGRTLAELGSRLIHADHAYEGAQDILYAAECFLEAGDCRPAIIQLERFSTLPQLAKVLEADAYMAAEHARLSTWGEKLRRQAEPNGSDDTGGKAWALT